MLRNRKHSSEQAAYQALLNAYWAEAPGKPGEAQSVDENLVKQYLTDPERVINAAVALGGLADEEMLLAGNLLMNNHIAEGWTLMEKSQAHADFYYRVLDHTVWRPSKFTQSVFGFHNLCARFSLNLAGGSESQIKWYAQQIYNLVRGGVADLSCKAIEYVDLYYVKAIAVLEDSWPDEKQLAPSLGPYRDLFLNIGNIDVLEKTLIECARYHLSLAAYKAPKNEEEAYHPYRVKSIGHIAYELLGWVALYRRLAGPFELKMLHPMLASALFTCPKHKLYEDDVLSQLRINAAKNFGSDWDNCAAVDIDKLS